MKRRSTPFTAIGAGILLVLLAAPAVRAGSSVDARIALLWSQGTDGDEVYERAAADTPERDLHVSVWHDKDDDEPYRRGEDLRVHFRTDRDLYVVVYRIDVDGEVEVLWPNSRYDDGFVYGDHTYTLPRPGSPVRLRTSERKGVEYVEAIASEYPFDLRGLGIDFAFDLDDREEYDYVIEGDPFLAVNDINFAITGLEEDVDYVVTDWTHLYVESKVDYPRYTCTQCHGDDEHDVHPYVDSCTTVRVYYDWGWQSRWYASFGWYPLYYEPPFYYWDVTYARPYWYAYYPVYYRWPGFRVYERPYPIYWWYDSPYYRGDFRVRYTSGRSRVRPLYDLQSPGTRRAIRDVDGRTRYALPPSVRGRGGEGRVDPQRLVRREMEGRDRRGLERGVDERTRDGRLGRGTPRTGIRRGEGPRDRRRITALQPRERTQDRREGIRRGRSQDEVDRGERRWTRPRVRDERNRSGVGADRDRRLPHREAKPDRRRSEPRRDVKPDRRRSEPRRDVKPDRRRSEPRRDVQPDRQRGDTRGEVSPDRRRGKKGRQVEPKKSEPKRQRVERSSRDTRGRKGRDLRPSSGTRARPQARSAPRSSSRSKPAPSRSSGSRSRGRGGRGRG